MATTPLRLLTPITTAFRVTEKERVALTRLGLTTLRDVLFYFPARYGTFSEVKTIAGSVAGDTVTLRGIFSAPKIQKGFGGRGARAEGVLTDTSGKIKVVWFNQVYLAKMIEDGSFVELTGKISEGKYGVFLSNPEFRTIPTLPIDSSDTLFADSDDMMRFGYAVYPETRGITSKWIYHTVQKILKAGVHKELTEYLPETILKKYNLPTLTSAIVFIHSPKNKNDAESAKKRFAFEEIFFVQLRRKLERKAYTKNLSYPIAITEEKMDEFITSLPFPLTTGQSETIESVLIDMSRGEPMARLVEGDVGSGKTAVAAAASYAVVMNRPLDTKREKTQTFGNLQVAIMAPTEILATQHFESFISYFSGRNGGLETGISVGLLTSSGCRKFPSKVASAVGKPTSTNISRAQLIKWIEGGEIPIVIGTHSLIAKSVKFRDLALVIVDEQHRFGSLQRAKLAKKEGFAPHFLSMTATPIPRTLALTIYGDLDLSLLLDMPKGRKPIKTEIVPPHKREETYEHIRRELQSGRQVYVICPRIDASDDPDTAKTQMKSVTAEAEKLGNDIFPEYIVDILHSKMTKTEKEDTMREFAEGKTHILVATSVVEVGVNVPNATNIIIEGADRFGLAQLHQLRGRVLRGTHQPYCFLFTDSENTKTGERLKALATAKNGFELAEHDLALRGAGELTGARQWGITDIGMEAIKNVKLVEAARAEATAIVDSTDEHLSLYPTLAQALRDKNIHLMHFE